ncbi:uncharacterized protein LOC119739800 isoform X1 [Patiria miniata]|uniref:FAD dependent oxidoreductase domain-containing protein n=2 Tax=Patiria miniata TaxID=46514 RepID=A0A914B440_PATMI|nr:uncharacterized protein LOC119739800 isoform X1 [Patiria miniata]
MAADHSWTSMVYDICIVGAGLWGSSAARHASLPGRKVCLIGPSEPLEKDRPSRDIFASYYDVARTVRKCQGSNHFRSLMTMRAFKGLQELEGTTGIQLNATAGHIFYGKDIESKMAPIAKEEGVLLTAEDVHKRYPFLDTSRYGDTAMLFPINGGHANPRMIVHAEQKAATLQGCDIFDDVVESVGESGSHTHGEPVMRVLTKNGRHLLAKKVLLCTGAFTQLKDLLPPSTELDFGIDGTFTVRLEVGEDDLEKISSMPTMTSFTDPEWNCYMLPPIKYPDGKYYVKIGPLNQDQRRLTSLKEVKDWFLSKPDPKLVEKYRDLLLSIVKGFNPVSVKADMCVCSRTPTGLPYCDMVSPRLGLAVGGNGCGALLSDEVGRMAAEMIAGGENWNRDIPREMLKAQFITPPSNL